MAPLGINGVFVPAKYGGAGLGYTEMALVVEEIGRHAAGLALGLVAHYMGVYAIMTWGSEEQKQKYLPIICSGGFSGLSVTEPGRIGLTGQKSTGRLVDGNGF